MTAPYTYGDMYRAPQTTQLAVLNGVLWVAVGYLSTTALVANLTGAHYAVASVWAGMAVFGLGVGLMAMHQADRQLREVTP